MKMRRKLKVAVFFIFLGLIVLLISQYRIDREIESFEENGREFAIYATENKPIVCGTNLTRHYKAGEKISLKFTPKQKPAFPDILPLNFTIISPGGNETCFVFWLEPYFNPLSTSSFPELVISELTILKVEKLIVVNSSKLTFVGEVIESGNYTLVFTSKYTEETSPIKYLALSKIVIEKTYPYVFMAPLGIGFLIMGAYTLKKSQRKTSLKTTAKKKGS